MNENTHALTITAGPSSLEWSPCPTCGIEVDWRGVHVCGPRRPTYDELALAVLEYGRVKTLGYDDAYRAAGRVDATLTALARRLEPGP